MVQKRKIQVLLQGVHHLHGGFVELIYCIGKVNVADHLSP